MTISEPTARDSEIFTGVVQSTLILLVVAFLCLPYLFFGITDYPGSDASIHLAYVHDFSRQFWGGELYPRWLTSENEGYGSPIFLAQYPLPYFITALLRPITSFPPNSARDARELGILCFLVLVAAAFAARRWFRNSCKPWAATIASLVYISLPFILGLILNWACIGQLCTFVWMPLALAICDSIQPRFTVVTSLGVVLALLLLSHVLTTILFLPLLLGYTAIGCGRSADTSRIRRLGAMLLAFSIGVAIAAAYMFPLVAYRNLFDFAGLQSIMPAFEPGRWFPGVSSSALSKRSLLVALVYAICITLVAAYYVWRAGRGRVSRLLMMLTLGLGVVLIVPDLGQKLIHWSGLQVSSFDFDYEFPAQMLCTILSTAALGFIAYCRISEVGTSQRDQVLLIGACGAVLLMLPWSAFLWKAIPQLAIFQFPHRLCAILSIAVAGLFAVALDSCLRKLPSGGSAPSQGIVIFLAFAVIAGGVLTWRVDRRFRYPSTVPVVDPTQNGLVDPMYLSYVSRVQLAEFAKSLGASVDSWDIVPKRVDEGLHAEFTEGRGSVNIYRIGPRKLHVFTQCLEDACVKISQVYMPLWRVVPARESSSSPVLRSSADGLLEVVLAPGAYEFNLVFDGGAPERYGLILTLVSSVTVVSGLAVQFCRKCLWTVQGFQQQRRQNLL
jgi:hypothetical protein